MSHAYSASESAGKIQKQFVTNVLRRVFRGSARQLIQHVLSGKRSKTELDEIRRMLDEYERKL